MDRTVKLFLYYNFFAILFALGIILFISHFYLYSSALAREKNNMQAIASSSANMIEAVAKFDEAFSKEDNPDGSEGATLSQIKDFIKMFSKGSPQYDIKIVKIINNKYIILDSTKSLTEKESKLWIDNNIHNLKNCFNQKFETNESINEKNTKIILAFGYINILNYGIFFSIDHKFIKKPYDDVLWSTAITCILLCFLLGIYSRSKAEPIVVKINSEVERNKLSLQNHQVTLNSIGDGVITTDINGLITRMNPIAEKLTGWKLTDALNRPLVNIFKIINALNRIPVENPVQKVISTGELIGLTNHTLLISKDGKEHHISDSAAPIIEPNGKIIGVVLVFRDNTDEYKMQEQLRQSQKMDAIGKLASGIAHDFNNMLGVILMSIGMLKKHRTGNEWLNKPLELIAQSAQHAAALTKNLLTFSAKKTIKIEKIKLHDVINKTVNILQATIDKRIKINLLLNASIDEIMGDFSALHSAMMNIGINASHAMPKGGFFSITTQDINLTQLDCDTKYKSLNPGKYIQVEFTDNGSGISQENLNKIFEPFFTTKNQGQGTGLGLATVYGTIHQHEGEIKVNSELNKGTTFTILLPLYKSHYHQDLEKSQNYLPKIGNGHILFIEDEEGFREAANAILTDQGYKVTLAQDGSVAVDLYKNIYKEVDLVITDMMMPEMNGLDCFCNLKKINPNIKAILVTGYSDSNSVDKILKEGVLEILDKPYDSTELLSKIEKYIS